MKQLKYNTADNGLIWESLAKSRIIREGAGWETHMGALYTGADKLLDNWYEWYIDKYKDFTLPQLEKEMDAVGNEVEFMKRTVQKSQERTETMSAGPVGSFYRPDLYEEEEVNEINDLFAKQQAVGWLFMAAANARG
jgi:hypothetical protein